jgi:FixJ family two-component response regulator
MISVVDDDPSIRRALRRLLHSIGFECQTYGSAQEFFECKYEQKTECLILDIHLGGMTGFELQQKMLAEGFNPPVIYITAHDDEKTREQAERAGAIAYLRKPFTDQSLIDAIDTAIHGKKS